MNISLGLTEKSNLSKSKQTEIYNTIIDAAKFLMRADCALIRFINTEKKILEKEVRMKSCNCTVKNDDIMRIGDSILSEKIESFLILSSHHQIKNVRCFLIVNGYEEQEGKTVELLRVMASQALFVYSYAGSIAE
jgi:hypothetical protein